MRAIDTNVLVRALVRNEPASARRAEALLRDHPVYVPVTVILELEWVLRSRYGFSATVISQALEKISALEKVVIAERDAVIAAAGKLARGWDFADALHHALSFGCEDFVTLDADLSKRARRMTAVEPRVTRL